MYISHLRKEKNLENQSKIIEEGDEVAQCGHFRNFHIDFHFKDAIETELIYIIFISYL